MIGAVNFWWIVSHLRCALGMCARGGAKPPLLVEASQRSLISTTSLHFHRRFSLKIQGLSDWRILHFGMAVATTFCDGILPRRGLDLGDANEGSYEKRIYSKVRSYSPGADQRIQYRRSRPNDGRRSGTIGPTECADGDGPARGDGSPG